MMTNVVQDALDAAAGAGDDSLTGLEIGRRALPTERRITGAREVVKRFLEQLPGEMSVFEVLELLDG